MAPDKEPITPLIAKIRSLAAMDVSCILVIGGSGDYFQVADRVIAMDCYAAEDVTDRARAIISQAESPRLQPSSSFGSASPRMLKSVLPQAGDGLGVNKFVNAYAVA